MPRFRVNELIYDPIGSMFDGHFRPGTYGGHQHVHAAAKNMATMLAIIRKARQLGLSVRENPFTDPVDPVHTEGSHHYQEFKRLFRGREVGKAADISGDADDEAELFRWIRAQAGGRVPRAGRGGGGMAGGGGGQSGSQQQLGAILQMLRSSPIQSEPLSYRSPADVLAGLTPQPSAVPPRRFQVPDFAADAEQDLLELRRSLLA